MNQNRLTKENKRWIRPLPKNVINKIAAGEVVERPAAIVKELVENSIDASANKIDIIVEKSGAKLIKIIDNGCGITPEQMEIAFSRHATSKISEFNDLDSLDSYGFRGEALPSIASVSRLRMVSRTNDSDIGEEILFEGGILKSKQPHPASIGTVVEVENLFFNTPARRKFLKAESTEARHISRIAMAMAIGRPDIGFSYKLNGRNVFSLPADSNLKERTGDLLALSDELVELSSKNSIASIHGYIGLPQSARNNRNSLFLFINNRFIHSATLAHGVSSGYKELLPRGKFPLGVIHLQVESSKVDVNVHPTKIEVRLSNEREIHDFIYQAVKESLRRDGIIPLFVSNNSGHSLTGYRDTSPNYKQPSHQAQNLFNREENKNLVPEMLKSASSSDFSAGTTVISSRVNTATGEILEKTSQTNDLTDSAPSEQFQYKGQISLLYLLIQSGQDLFIVDQHTAHERVLYEETLVKINKQQINGQQLLFPVQVELDPEQYSVFEGSLDLLNSSGFTVSGFGGRTVNIEAIPAVLSKKSPETIFSKIIDDIASLNKAGLDVKKSMAQSIACRAAIMAGDKISEREATSLIKSLIKCDNRYSCPHGRPTFIKISKRDLDSQFGRL